jgi:ribonuclease HI
LDRWDLIGGAYLIRLGLTPEYIGGTPPAQLSLTNQKCPKYHGVMDTLMEREIQEELENGIIKVIPRRNAKLILRSFLRPKPGGQFRKILDCTPLNSLLLDRKFKMQDTKTVQQVLRKGMWGATIDIQKAFHHIRVADSFVPYLCTEYKGTVYAYTSMPFGVKPAPRTFTKVMHHCLCIARREWKVHIIQYIDDILVLHQDFNHLRDVVEKIVEFLERLGWLINKKKSILTPRQFFTYLGWEWNTNRFTVRLTEERRASLAEMIQKWKKLAMLKYQISIKSLASFIGKLSQTRLQFQQASLFLSFLNILKTKAVRRKGWKGKVEVSKEILKDLDWWERKLEENSERSLETPPLQGELWTDASASGWGAVIVWKVGNKTHEMNLYGHWENQWSSNRRELEAVRRALCLIRRKSQLRLIRHYLLHCDNTTTTYNINRKACAHSLIYPMRYLFNLMEGEKVMITARHISGVKNNIADSLSRLSRSADYGIDRSIVYQKLEEMKVEITLDLFASKTNHIHEIYCTLSIKDKKAWHRDAFTVDWRKLENPFIHPPIPLIQRCVNLVRESKIKAVFVVPMWPHQWWTTSLMEISTKIIHLGKAQEILTPGKSFSARGYSLPPGEMVMHIVDGKIETENH